MKLVLGDPIVVYDSRLHLLGETLDLRDNTGRSRRRGGAWLTLPLEAQTRCGLRGTVVLLAAEIRPVRLCTVCVARASVRMTS